MSRVVTICSKNNICLGKYEEMKINRIATYRSGSNSVCFHILYMLFLEHIVTDTTLLMSEYIILSVPGRTSARHIDY